MDLSIVTDFLSQGVVLATAGSDGWGDGDGGWWIVRLAFLTLWILLIFFVLRWLVFGRWGRHGGPNGIERARAILAERYARGEIDAAEYQERLERLS